jgi:cytochrome c-type biogenesis protein CcmH/NrfG
LRKHYLLAGVALALALATLVVAVGLRSGDSSGTAGATSTDALPSGHPAVEDSGAAVASPAPSASSSIEQTIARLRGEVADDPEDVAALLELGDAYFIAQHNARAATVFADVLALDPDNAAAKVKLAMVWHADGETKRAEKAITKVLAARPDDQEAHYSLAIIYFSTDRSHEAREQWQKAAVIAPTTVIGRRSQSFVDLLDGKDSESPESDD